MMRLMKGHLRQISIAALFVVCGSFGIGRVVTAQQGGGLSAAEKARRWDTENELQRIGVVDRKVMMPMPDGVRLATDIYRPKSAGPSAKVPIVFVRTPYNV